MKILWSIQDLLNNPNTKDPAQTEAYTLFLESKKEYEERIMKQAEQFRNLNMQLTFIYVFIFSLIYLFLCVVISSSVASGTFASLFNIKEDITPNLHQHSSTR